MSLKKYPRSNYNEWSHFQLSWKEYSCYLRIFNVSLLNDSHSLKASQINDHFIYVCGNDGKNSVMFITTAMLCNEREEFMQETQHTQQTATRTAQNQEHNINVNGYKNTEDTQKQTNI